MWLITNDLQDDGKKIGSSSLDYEPEHHASLKYQFRLLDDDDEIYYEGKSDVCDSEKAFDPLDDFGRGYAGCTAIHYFDGENWNHL